MNKFFTLLLVLFCLVPLLGNRLQPNAYSGGRSRDANDRAIRNSSAIAMMLGELRTSMSDIMLIKTERYLDSGVAYVPHLGKSISSISGAANAIDQNQAELEAEGDHSGHEDEVTSTIIPTAKEDFRGFIGYLERQIKPWRDPGDPHQHTNGTELLPWYRVITMTDPHNVRAFAIGGFWLKNENLDEGLKFLEEGIKNNPDAFQLRLTLGRLYLEKVKEFRTPEMRYGDRAPVGSEMEKFYGLAKDQFLQAADRAIQQRPQNWQKNKETPGWDIYLEDDALEAMRLAVWIEMYQGNRKSALDKAIEFNSHVNDGNLQKQIQRLSQPESDSSGP